MERLRVRKRALVYVNDALSASLYADLAEQGAGLPGLFVCQSFIQSFLVRESFTRLPTVVFPCISDHVGEGRLLGVEEWSENEEDKGANTIVSV